MMKHYQKGEIAAAMLVMMVVMVAAGWLWKGHMGMGHGGDRADHAPAASSAAQPGSKGESDGKPSGNKSEQQDEHTHD